ncbi:hypothetical protein [Arthrobacter sp. B6]|uniref:hypothetical protein n=1 Tax=Arthrobacter sp. B6 TaxID=1570137 RepID=UPI00082954E1|nr:hypothetical protein [Arthrobacter sp. B6]
MDAIPAVILVFGVAFVWIGLTVFIVLRLRRHRNGSSLVASAPPPAEADRRPHRPWRRVRPLTGATLRQRRLRPRKVRG